MGTKFFGFFLYQATGSASIFGSLPHPFARLYARAFGNSIPSSSLFSKHGQDDTLPQSAFLLLQQYASESIGRLNNQPSKVPSIESSQAFSAGLLLVVKGVQGLAWILTPRSLLYHIPQPSVLYYLARLLQHWLLCYNLCQTQVKLLLEAFSFPSVARFQVVSCHYFNMYLLFMRISIKPCSLRPLKGYLNHKSFYGPVSMLLTYPGRVNSHCTYYLCEAQLLTVA